MSVENFLSFLQQLITMTDPDDKAAVALAKSALFAVSGLARSSGKIDPMTNRIMLCAEMRLELLIRHKADFAGTPGDYAGNQRKRHRLLNMLSPGC